MIEFNEIVIAFIVFAIIWIVLFILFLFTDFDYDVCFRKSINDGIADKDGCCGLTGGDHNTNYLQYDCIGCPYLKNIIDKD